MIDALVEFIYLIKEFILGIVDGLINFIGVLMAVWDMFHFNGIGDGSLNLYFPSAVMTIVGLCASIGIVLRVIGR